MDGQAERGSQEVPPDVRGFETLPGADEIRDQEISRIFRDMIHYRPFAVPVLLLLVLALVLIEPTRDRLVAWAVFAGVGALVFWIDRARKRDGWRLAHLPYDLLIAWVIQTLVIATTGLLESPMLPVYLLLAVLAGVGLGPSPVYFSLLLLILGGIWGMAFLEVRIGLTRFPAFFSPAVELASDPVRVYGRAAVTSLILLIASQVARVAHNAVRRMIDTAIRARQQLLLGLADRNRELVSLSGAIAHELKNPLASIQGLVQLLERSEENREKRFEVLRREIDRMKVTLDEFLNFSRPIGDLVAEPVDPGGLFDELSALHEGLIAKKHLQLEAPPGHEGLVVSGDPRKLKQALTNLLQNAIDASPEGAAIDWVCERQGETVLLGVRDRGPGLAPELRERGPAPGVTTKPSGSGIGLLVARVIAEQHGGRLALRDATGGGLAAVLELPVRGEGHG